MRYDYEELTIAQGALIMQGMETIMNTFNGDKDKLQYKNIKLVDNFTYIDPIDGSISTAQGYRVIFENKDRIIVRQSGTGSSGATIRIYVEHFETDINRILLDKEEMLKERIKIALEMTKIEEISGRQNPTVIT